MSRYKRIYFKREDNKQQLPSCDQRARIEIRLQGDDLPVTTLDELRDFNFASLSNYFKFRRLRTDLDDFTKQMIGNSTRIGQPYRLDRNGQVAPINRKGGGTREYSKYTRADTPLNDLARDQLRKLTRRWKGVASAPDTNTHCGFSGDYESTFANNRRSGQSAFPSQRSKAGTRCGAGVVNATGRDDCPTGAARSKDYGTTSTLLTVRSGHEEQRDERSDSHHADSLQAPATDDAAMTPAMLRVLNDMRIDDDESH